MKRLRPAQRRLRAALGAAAVTLLAAAPAAAHWLEPEEIIAGLSQNQGLRQKAGLVSVRADPALPRLLVIRVNADQWQSLPAEQRLSLAQQWQDDWSHNVEAGIVAILDAKTDAPLVNYDATGTARLERR